VLVFLAFVLKYRHEGIMLDQIPLKLIGVRDGHIPQRSTKLNGQHLLPLALPEILQKFEPVEPDTLLAPLLQLHLVDQQLAIPKAHGEHIPLRTEPHRSGPPAPDIQFGDDLAVPLLEVPQDDQPVLDRGGEHRPPRVQGEEDFLGAALAGH
jgi:hypothetical protein